MRRKLLFLLFFCIATIAKAENEPVITLNVEVNEAKITLGFEVSTPNTKLSIDWGDGVLVETETIQTPDPYLNATDVVVTPKGEGLIKIYGENIVYFSCAPNAKEAKVTALDVTKAVHLTELYANTNKLTSLDVSKNTKLQILYCGGNPITALDLTNNISLIYLNANDMGINKLDVSKCPELDYLSFNNNKLEALDISKNTKLKKLYCLNNQIKSIDFSKNTILDFVNVNNNQLTSIDVTACPALTTLFCMGNQIKEIKVGNIEKTLNCSKNKLTLNSLPKRSDSGYTYAPQEALTIAESISTNQEFDLSAQDNIKGVTETAQKTTYTWKTADGATTLVAGTDYTEKNGKFTFLTSQNQPVYCEMTSDAFPKFTGTNVFKTTPISIQKLTGVQDNISDNIIIMPNKGEVTIEGLKIADSILIYTINGKKVIDTKASNDTMTFNLAEDNYIVRINNKVYKTIVL